MDEAYVEDPVIVTAPSTSREPIGFVGLRSYSGPVTPIPDARTSRPPAPDAPPPPAARVRADSSPPRPRRGTGVLAGLQVARVTDGAARTAVENFERQSRGSLLLWPSVNPSGASAPAILVSGVRAGFVLGSARLTASSRRLGVDGAAPGAASPSGGLRTVGVIERLVCHPRLPDPAPLAFRLVERLVVDASFGGFDALIACVGLDELDIFASMGFRPWRSRAAPHGWAFIEVPLDERQLAERGGALGPTLARVRRVRTGDL